MSDFSYEDWLAHFNPNHDPSTGQFSSKSGLGVRLLEKKIRKTEKRVQKRDSEIERVKQKAEQKAYSPLSNYERAEEILGDKLRKRLREKEFKFDKAIRTGAKAYQKLLKKQSVSEMNPEIVKLGEKYTSALRESMSNMKMAGLYKALTSDYNTSINLPADSPFIKNLESL